MNVAEIISIVSVLISVISTSIAAFAIANNVRLKEKDVNMQNYEDIRDWFERTLLILKELYIKFPTNKNREDLERVLVKFGTVIDVGRLYFRNRLMGDYKLNKPEIFRGRRVLILDILVLYFDIYDQGIQEENRDVLWGLQRAYISETVQFLEKNLSSRKFVEYTYIDKNNTLDIANIKDEHFRELLRSSDIVKAIKTKDEEILSQAEPQKDKTQKSK